MRKSWLSVLGAFLVLCYNNDSFAQRDSLGLNIGKLKCFTDCLKDPSIISGNLKSIDIKKIDFSDHRYNASLNETTVISLNVHESKIHLVRCAGSDLTFIIHDQGDYNTYNQGFFVKHSDNYFYVSFEGGQAASESYDILDLYLKLLSEGKTDKINSIMLLDNNLRSMYSIKYRNSKPLYIVRSIYSDQNEFKYLLVCASEFLSDFKLDTTFDDVFDKISRFKHDVSQLIPVAKIEPHMSPNHQSYLWMVEDKYQNSLLYQKDQIREVR